jgi:hypothetical protein
MILSASLTVNNVRISNKSDCFEQYLIRFGGQTDSGQTWAEKAQRNVCGAT